MTGPTNPRFTWPEEVRRLQREAIAAVDALIRAETAAEAAAGQWDMHDEGRLGTIIDDLNESGLTGFILIAQYQFMVGDPEDSIALVSTSGTLTRATQVGLVRDLHNRFQ